MLSCINKRILHILIKCLNGNKDLCYKIILIKNECILNELKEQYIERDFYNYLSYDIYIRNKLGKIKIKYSDYNEDEREEFIYNDMLAVTEQWRTDKEMSMYSEVV